jgi:hypothetical protein
MKYLKMLGLAAVAAMALTAIIGAGTASATELYKYTTPSANDTLGAGTAIEATLKGGTSALLKDTGGSTNDTCTGSTVGGTITNSGGSGLAVSGTITTLDFTGCTHTTDPLPNSEIKTESGVIHKEYGTLEIKWISGTTNGTVVSKNTKVTVQSTVFGISCVANTGEGTVIGTLTGAKSSTEHATMHINGVIEMGICGDSTWTGTYLVTNPTGLTVEDK